MELVHEKPNFSQSFRLGAGGDRGRDQPHRRDQNGWELPGDRFGWYVAAPSTRTHPGCLV